MARFFSPPPSSVKLDGIEYEINTDFRIWIQIEKQLTSSHNDSLAALAKCLCLAYRTLPPSPPGALEGMLSFYSAGQAPLKSSQLRTYRPPSFDLEADCEYIYSSFMSQYGIDLCEASLHWWKFRALLFGLNEDCLFKRIISYRNAVLHNIKDPVLRDFYAKMKRLYALPDNRSDPEKELDMCECMAELFE